MGLNTLSVAIIVMLNIKKWWKANAQKHSELKFIAQYAMEMGLDHVASIRVLYQLVGRKRLFYAFTVMLNLNKWCKINVQNHNEFAFIVQNAMEQELEYVANISVLYKLVDLKKLSFANFVIKLRNIENVNLYNI